MADCSECEAPNRFCVCVYRARIRGLEQENRRLGKDRSYYLRLFQAAASALAYNRDRLRRPRGEDERRLLALAASSITHGPFYAGTTDGNLPEPEIPDPPEEDEEADPRTLITYLTKKETDDGP